MFYFSKENTGPYEELLKMLISRFSRLCRHADIQIEVRESKYSLMTFSISVLLVCINKHEPFIFICSTTFLTKQIN